MATLYEVAFVARIPSASGPPTLTELGPVKFSGLSWSDELGGDGRLDVATKIDSLDAPIKARLTQLDQTPNELWLYRNGTRVFAGPVTSYDVQNKRVLTMYAPGLSYYLEYMIRDTDYAQTGVDQSLIAKDLVDTYQAQSYAHFGLDTVIPGSGTFRDLSLKGAEGKTLGSIIRTMGQRENGFDLAVDPVGRRIKMYSPRRGADLSTTVVIDRRNIVLPKVMLSVAAGIFATRATVASSSTTAGNLTSSAVNSVQEARFGRVMVAQQFSDISVQSTLDDHATRLAGNLSSPSFVVAPDIAPVTGLMPGDVAPGDQVTYDYDVGLGAQTLVRRITKIQVTVKRGKERMALTFL